MPEHAPTSPALTAPALTAPPRCVAEMLSRPLAMSRTAHADLVRQCAEPQAFFFDWAPPVPELEDVVAIEGALGVIHLSGVLCRDIDSAAWLGGTLLAHVEDAAHQLLGDDRVAACVIVGDSPGGDVWGTFEAAAAVRRLAEAKPTTAIACHLLASAAYVIASQAGSVATTADAQLGSMGVMVAVDDDSEWLKKMGITRHVIGSVAGKGELWPGVPFTDEAIARERDNCIATHEHMAAVIQAARPALTPDAIAALDAGTRVGQSAVDAGLADGVTTLDDLIDSMLEVHA